MLCLYSLRIWTTDSEIFYSIKNLDCFAEHHLMHGRSVRNEHPMFIYVHTIISGVCYVSMLCLVRVFLLCMSFEWHRLAVSCVHCTIMKSMYCNMVLSEYYVLENLIIVLIHWNQIKRSFSFTVMDNFIYRPATNSCRCWMFGWAPFRLYVTQFIGNIVRALKLIKCTWRQTSSYGSGPHLPRCLNLKVKKCSTLFEILLLPDVSILFYKEIFHLSNHANFKTTYASNFELIVHSNGKTSSSSHHPMLLLKYI